MAKERGLRSSNDAEAWRCRCDKVNQPTKHRFFDLPAWQCRRCTEKFDGNFKFCLGEIEVDGGSLIGEVRNQKEKPYCVAFAYSKAVEISERVWNVNNQIDPNKVKCINPAELQQIFEDKFPKVCAADFLVRDFGIHKVVHMGLILREEGIEKGELRDLYKAEDLSAIARDDFEEIARLLAEGVPLLATYHVGKRKAKLKYCQVYKSPPLEGKKYCGHAVVLIGAGIKNGRKFFYILNSWGHRFCPRKNIRGEIKMSGIGKLRACDLTKNVIKLSQPHKTDACWRLEAQNEYRISKENYLLMMATKKQYASFMLHKARLVEPQGDDESGKQQCDQNDFDKIQEDHLDHGAFCDDEAEYLQALEDRYDEPSTGSESTTGTPAPNTNPLPNHWSTNAGDAQGATWSGAAGNIRNGATGGLGGLGSADMGSMFGGLPDASRLNQIVQNPAMMQNFMSDLQSMNQLLSIKTNACNRVESNNHSREMFQNPEFLHQLTSPELQQLLSFQHILSSQLGQHQPSRDGDKGSNGAGMRGKDGFGTLMGMLNGLGAGGGIGVPNT